MPRQPNADPTRVPTPRARSARASIVAAWLSSMLVGLIAIAAGPAAAQERGDAEPEIEVTVVALADAERRDIIEVTVGGLDRFVDGTLAVYLCGNADATGQVIAPGERDCFAPGTDGYLTRPIDSGAAIVRYRLQRDDIGVNGARCLPALDGWAPCQLVVGAVKGADTEVTGVALDDVLADLDEAAAPVAPEPVVPGDATPGDDPASLPLTGAGTRGIAVSLLVAAALFYLGWLAHSATQPAETC